MDITLESRMREIEELVANGQYSEVEHVWPTAAKEADGNAVPFLGLARTIAAGGQPAKAAALLFQLVEPMLAAGHLEAACDVVNQAALIEPAAPSLIVTARKAYSSRFDGVEGFDAVLAVAEEKFTTQPGKYVDHLRELCSYKVGDFLFHDAGWGLGRVIKLDLANRTLTIDFPDSKDHEVDLTAATKFFRKLPSTHLMARKAADIEALKGEAEHSPAALLRCVMRSLEGKITLKRIREALSPDVVSKGEWTKWWARVKNELTKKGALRVGAGANPTVELLHIPSSFDTEFSDKLAACHTAVDFGIMLKKYGEETKERTDRAPYIAEQFKKLGDLILTRDPVPDGEKVLAKMLLDDLKEGEPTLELDYPLDLVALCMDNQKVLAALEQIKIAEYEHRLLHLIKEHNPTWAQVYADALLRNIPDSWDLIADTLLEEKENDKLAGSARLIYQHGYKPGPTLRTYPLQYMWLATRIISLGTPQQFGVNVAKTAALFEMLRLGMALYHRVEKGEKSAKKYMLKFRATLSERNSRMLRVVLDECDADQARHLLDHFQVNRALSEARVESTVAIFRDKFPQLQTHEETAPKTGEDDGVILTTPAGYRKKNNELRNILNVELPHIQKLIGEALAMGDISENAELDAAREREDVLRNQAATIAGELERAQVLRREDVDTSHAGFGTTLKLRNTDSGEVYNYTILGRWDVDSSKGIISDISAIGRGVSGLKAGERRTFQTPDGATVTYEVETLAAAPLGEE